MTNFKFPDWIVSANFQKERIWAHPFRPRRDTICKYHCITVFLIFFLSTRAIWIIFNVNLIFILFVITRTRNFLYYHERTTFTITILILSFVLGLLEQILKFFITLQCVGLAVDGLFEFFFVLATQNFKFSLTFFDRFHLSLTNLQAEVRIFSNAHATHKMILFIFIFSFSFCIKVSLFISRKKASLSLIRFILELLSLG